MSTVDLEEIATSTFDDVPEDVNAPDGVYLAEVVRTKLDKTQGGPEGPKPYIEVVLRPVQVVEGDLSDNDLANVYPVRDRLFLSEKAKKRTKQIFKNAFGLEVEGTPINTLIEMAIGQAVQIVVKNTYDHSKLDDEGNPRQYVNVEKYISAA